jgi:hypothetical protein
MEVGNRCQVEPGVKGDDVVSFVVEPSTELKNGYWVGTLGYGTFDEPFGNSDGMAKGGKSYFDVFEDSESGDQDEL